jgi:hypothetical protein
VVPWQKSLDERGACCERRNKFFDEILRLAHHHGAIGQVTISDTSKGFPNVQQAFKVLPRREAVNPLGRGFAKVPKENLVSVGIEAEGQFAAALRLNILAILLACSRPSSAFLEDFLASTTAIGFPFLPKRT